MNEKNAKTNKSEHGQDDELTRRRDAREQRAAEGHLKSQVIKRSLVVGGHKTSVSLEDAFWDELRAIAHKFGVHLSQLVGSIDAERQHSNLSSAIRLFVFEYRSHITNTDGMSPTAQAVLAGIKRLGVMH